MNPLRYFVTPIVLAFAVTACFENDPGARAERQYRMVAENGTAAERCEAALHVKAVYLEAENENKYDRWLVESNLVCFEAKYRS